MRILILAVFMAASLGLPGLDHISFEDETLPELNLQVESESSEDSNLTTSADDFSIGNSSAESSEDLSSENSGESSGDLTDFDSESFSTDPSVEGSSEETSPLDYPSESDTTVLEVEEVSSSPEDIEDSFSSVDSSDNIIIVSDDGAESFRESVLEYLDMISICLFIITLLGVIWLVGGAFRK